MVRIERNGERVRVHVQTIRPPAVYLDHCALSELSAPGPLHDRFVELFKTRGELFVSHINLMEIASCTPRRREGFRALLENIGPHFVPVNAVFAEVVEAELSGKSSPSPAISERLIEQIAMAGEASLMAVWDLFVTEDAESHKAFMQTTKDVMTAEIAKLSARADMEPPEKLRGPFRSPVPQGRYPTLEVVLALTRIILRERKAIRWQANDSHDFMHAVVPMAYAQAVVLDNRWARRASELQLGSDFAKPFSVTQLDAFLEWCSSSSWASWDSAVTCQVDEGPM